MFGVEGERVKSLNITLKDKEEISDIYAVKYLTPYTIMSFVYEWLYMPLLSPGLYFSFVIF